MNKKYGWEIVLMLLSYLLYYLVTYDGPPIRIRVLYYTHRTAQRVAYWSGRFGLAAEHAYHTEIERSSV